MEATLREFLDHAPVFLRYPGGEIVYWTEGCCELFGFTSAEAQGQVAHELLKTIFPENREAIESKLQLAGEWTGRLRQTAKDGRVIWTVSVWRLRNDTQSRTPIVVEQNTDVTAYVDLEEQRTLLTRELEHRVKNLLSVVQSIARNSFEGAPAEQTKKFEGRLIALAEANRLLREGGWGDADLRQIVCEVARALGIEHRLRLQGAEVTLNSAQAMTFALAVHELCTNAVKHGALSVAEGQVSVSWATESDQQHVVVQWEERGGPTTRPSVHRGFGTRLIQAIFARERQSPVVLRFEPAGLVCDMRLSTARHEASQASS